MELKSKKQSKKNPDSFMNRDLVVLISSNYAVTPKISAIFEPMWAGESTT